MGLENHKPTIAMVGMQCMYAVVTLSIRASLLQGMSSRVFVVYRQAIAFLLIAPVAYVSSRRNTSSCRMGWKSFWIIFVLALIGVTINQNIYFEGIYLASSSTASATGNLIPAITFLMAWAIGLEKVQMGSVRSMAKIFGTLICVVGAICMALVKGPKLLNAEFIVTFDGKMGGGDENLTSWLLGCLLLFGSTICWSFWLVLQVAASKLYPDHLSLTAWLCFIAAVQSAILTFFIEPDPSVWKLDSNFLLISCLYTGFSSAVSFFGQAWCISRRGPLFSAMFNPLCTVLVTVYASLFMHEQMYAGSLAGAVAVIVGLYVVLWGKAEDHGANKLQNDQKATITIICESSDLENCNVDLNQPLLANK
ncbi:PREDICTED: WAT1-related protein At4g30420 [Ipomoea nil]|uniref:WAT1-related protein At4g30420 n=1 Tax=Ipomoea nil TaxID=35883 RepID=UPI000900946C|nr:PREDICTED: WAT1-related protein At4g30420 [Ipomoea nil]